MGCSCYCGVTDGDFCELYCEKLVKAKKTHTCCECGCKIKQGETYEVASGVSDGVWFREKTCSVCKRIRDDLCYGGFVFGSLREVVRDCLGIELC